MHPGLPGRGRGAPAGVRRGAGAFPRGPAANVRTAGGNAVSAAPASVSRAAPGAPPAVPWRCRRRSAGGARRAAPGRHAGRGCALRWCATSADGRRGAAAAPASSAGRTGRSPPRGPGRGPRGRVPRSARRPVGPPVPPAARPCAGTRRTRRRRSAAVPVRRAGARVRDGAGSPRTVRRRLRREARSDSPARRYRRPGAGTSAGWTSVSPRRSCRPRDAAAA
ncbi:Uncharacterised protein [Acinetobacter baumannii]|nr:Uncharacterised protein [Acinetobacter baumannii]